MALKYVYFFLSLLFLCLIICECKMFAPNSSEFEDAPGDEEYTAVNKSKMKTSKQQKLMEKYMKANSHSLTIEMSSDHSEHMHVAGTQLSLICFGDEETYASITDLNKTKIHVDWRKDVTDFVEREENFRVSIYRDRLVIRPATEEDSGLYQCVIDNVVVGSMTIQILSLGESALEGLCCMWVLSAAGFVPFVLAIVIQHFFAAKRATLADIERREHERLAKVQKDLIEYEQANDNVRLLKTAGDYYQVYKGERPPDEMEKVQAVVNKEHLAIGENGRELQTGYLHNVPQKKKRRN